MRTDAKNPFPGFEPGERPRWYFALDMKSKLDYFPKREVVDIVCEKPVPNCAPTYIVLVSDHFNSTKQ